MISFKDLDIGDIFQFADNQKDNFDWLTFRKTARLYYVRKDSWKDLIEYRINGTDTKVILLGKYK